MAHPTRIYLTGFMGSGKSTVGPIVANVLGFDFVDLDEAIAAEAGRPAAQLFAEEGEAAFRAREARLLRATAGREAVVVSVGGGALATAENMAWALANGTVVYLRLSPELLVHRLRRARGRRPLLLDAQGRRLPEAVLRTRVEALFARRRPFYEQAHVVVDVGLQRVGRTVDDVVAALRRYEHGQAATG